MAEEQTTKEEQIGYHKGALQTLSNERNELLRLVSIVDQFMQMHLKSLKELGVDLSPQTPEKQNKEKKQFDKLLR